ncbi:hypothetical protein P9112_008966 [Eukaryota sp. TZLM1-RC]
MSLKPTGFFGGAVCASIPPDWRDFSLDRPVQDNQEIFVDRSSGSVFVIDIVESPSVDASSMGKFHFDDLSESNGMEGAMVDSSGEPPFSMNLLTVPHQSCFLVGSGTVEDYIYEDDKSKTKTLYTYLTILRFKESNTDILVYITDATENQQLKSVYFKIMATLEINTKQLGL